MPEAPASVIDLKKDAMILASIGVCRSCFVRMNFKIHTHCAYANDTETCSMKGCENPCAFRVNVQPFEIKQAEQN